MFTTPTPRDGPTYRELRAELGPLGERLPAIYAALGLSEPEPRPSAAGRRGLDHAAIRLELGDVDPGGDADVRVARLVGEPIDG